MMTAIQKIALSNGSWFNLHASTVFEEKTFKNGNQTLGCFGQSEFCRTRLYYTRKCKWVCEYYKLGCNNLPGYNLVDYDFVKDWFIKNNYPEDQIPIVICDMIHDSEI